MSALGMPPHLLVLFQARPPLEYIKPVERRGNYRIDGIAEFANCFTNDEPPKSERFETPRERRDKRKRERIIGNIKSRETLAQLYDPRYDPKIASGATTSWLTHDPYRTLFITNIAYEVTERQLWKEFEVYGKIKRIRMIVDRMNKPRGYAFVEYDSEREMVAAYKRADGKKICGRRVIVDVERARTVQGWLPRRLGGGKGPARGAPPKFYDGLPLDPGKFSGSDGKFSGSDGKNLECEKKFSGSDGKISGLDGKNSELDKKNSGSDGRNLEYEKKKLESDGRNLEFEKKKLEFEKKKMELDKKKMESDMPTGQADGSKPNGSEKEEEEEEKEEEDEPRPAEKRGRVSSLNGETRAEKKREKNGKGESDESFKSEQSDRSEVSDRSDLNGNVERREYGRRYSSGYGRHERDDRDDRGYGRYQRDDRYDRYDRYGRDDRYDRGYVDYSRDYDRRDRRDRR